MYCTNCGQEISDEAVVCIHCGVGTAKPTAAKTVEVKPDNKRFIGFILSFFIPLAGLIVSIVEYRQAKEEGSTTSFAFAGIVISIVSMVLTLIITIIAMVYMFALMETVIDATSVFIPLLRAF